MAPKKFVRCRPAANGIIVDDGGRPFTKRYLEKIRSKLVACGNISKLNDLIAAAFFEH